MPSLLLGVLQCLVPEAFCADRPATEEGEHSADHQKLGEHRTRFIQAEILCILPDAFWHGSGLV